MPSIRYINQSAPFWDFVASLEQQGQDHPFFARQRGTEGESSGDEQPPFGPWGWGPGPWHHRGRGGFPHHHRGPPPPPGPHGPPPFGPHGPPPPGPPPPPGQEDDMPDAPDNGEGPSNPEEPPRGPPEEGRRHRHGCHGRRGGGFGGRRGGWGGPWGRHGGRGGFGGPFNFGALAAQLFQDNEESARDGETKDKDFEPEADVFDTESSFVVHVSLPGAKKEDVGVNWDSEKSELSIAGVIYRPGDEDFLKTLAMDERHVGPFERKVRLGTRANPAQIDADYITAKLEDGVLRVEVPKLDKDFVEVRKVDIE